MLKEIYQLLGSGIASLYFCYRAKDANKSFFNEIKASQIESNNLKNSLQKVDTIFFGDSVITYSEANDVSRQSISDLFNIITKTNLYSFSSESMSPLLWYKIVKKYKNSGVFDNKTIIIEINMRYFSNEWYYRPCTNFVQADYFFKSGINKIISYYKSHYTSFIANEMDYFYDSPFPSDDYLKQSDYFKDCLNIREVYLKLKSFVSNADLQTVASNFLYYGYSQRELKTRLSELISLIKALLSCKSKILLYFTPINFETLDSRTDKRCRENIQFLIEQMNSINQSTNENLRILDLSNIVKSQEFYSREHLKFNGRKIVANYLAEYFIKKFYLFSRIRSFDLYKGFVFYNYVPKYFYDIRTNRNEFANILYKYFDVKENSISSKFLQNLLEINLDLNEGMIDQNNERLDDAQNRENNYYSSVGGMIGGKNAESFQHSFRIRFLKSIIIQIFITPLFFLMQKRILKDFRIFINNKE